MSIATEAAKADHSAFTISDLDDSMTVAEIAAAARVHKGTVRAWQNEGCRGRDGRNHVLPFVQIGKRRYVRRGDLSAFIEAINARP